MTKVANAKREQLLEEERRISKRDEKKKENKPTVWFCKLLNIQITLSLQLA